MFAKNLKYLRNKVGMEQIELAKLLGRKSSSSISEWEKGKYTPKIGVLNEIARIFDVNIDDLMSLDLSIDTGLDITPIFNKLDVERKYIVYHFAASQLEKQSNNLYNLEAYQNIVIQSKVSAGTGILDLDPEAGEEKEVYSKVPEVYDLAFEIDGDSMEPLFEDGELIYVRCTTDIDNGQIIIVQINEEAFIKKAYLEDGQLRLVSLNKKYDDIIANGDDNIRVIGRVIL